MNLVDLMAKYAMQATGVLHVGAHKGEEADVYDAIGMPAVVWIEADPDVYVDLKKTIEGRGRHCAFLALVDHTNEKVLFHVANNSQSSSLLQLGTHRQHHPEVHYVAERHIITTTIDQLWHLHSWSSLNFWNLDIQGAELRALQGGRHHLAGCDYLYCEVNKEQLYVGCPLVEEIDAYLSDFVRVETCWTPHAWGDALYVRKALL